MSAAEACVLPSHGDPFVGLHVRIQQLHDHHNARLDELVPACRAAWSISFIIRLSY